MYEWGVKPQFTTGRLEPVADSYVFQKGEIGEVRGHAFYGVFPQERQATPVPTEKEFADAYVAEIERLGGKVTYISVSMSQEYAPNVVLATYKVERCIFVGSPIGVLAIIAIVLIVIMVLGVVYAPVVYKWAGVSPADVSGYLGSLGGVLGGAGGLLLLAILFLFMLGRK